MIGEPTRQNSHPDGKVCWYYRREPYLAELRVIFSADGKVESWHYDR